MCDDACTQRTSLLGSCNSRKQSKWNICLKVPPPHPPSTLTCTHSSLLPTAACYAEDTADTEQEDQPTVADDLGASREASRTDAEAVERYSCLLTPPPFFPAPLSSLSFLPLYRLMFQTSVFGLFLLPSSPSSLLLCPHSRPSPTPRENKHPYFIHTLSCMQGSLYLYSYRTSLRTAS